MARFTVDPNLDANVARTLVPVVRRLADGVRDGARRAAPPAKTWLSARDERVRDSHVHTDGQTIPDNLRYVLPSATVEGETDLAREPRDPALPIANAINCRCESVPLPGAVADSIHAGDTQNTGTRVHAEVSTDYTRAGESEVGTTTGDTGARFMRAGLEEAAARFREYVR